MKAAAGQAGKQVSEVPSKQWGSGKGDARDRADAVSRPRPQTPVQIPAEGYALLVAWNSVRGATGLALDDAAGVVSIAPSPILESMTDLVLTRDGNHRVYANPGKKRILRLTIRGLKMTGEGNPVYARTGDFSAPTTDGKTLRLVVSSRASASDAWMPVFAIPSVPARGAIPPMFTGAAFSNEVLSFPYALNGQLRLTLFEKEKPEEFVAQPMEISSVGATVEALPLDLELTGPAGDVLWSFPGEFPVGAPQAAPSLRVPIELALKADIPAALAEGRPLRAEFRLKGKAAQQAVFLSFAQPRGAILRENKAMLHCDLAGDPVPIPFGAELDAQAPTEVSGGMSIRYLGLRLLPELSASLPAPGETVEGSVVRDAPVYQAFPPAGLRGLSLGKIGIIGRAPEDCELEAQLVRMRGDAPGLPLGPPGRLPVGKSDVISTVWIDLPEMEATEDPLAVSLRALRGRFFWAALSSGRRRVCVVVRDPDPAHRPLLLGASVLLTVDAPSIDVPMQAFPSSQFHSAPPMLSSELFLAVDISGLTLKYTRP
ncbi:MAG: hypothetical protein IPP94_05095 [Ignavibacteria bacterium]|nr:hypothetical protein [Ignavibacteria bacterium]